MTAREEILNRIREALRVPAAPGPEQATAAEPEAPGERGRFLPPAPATFDERLALFRARSEDLKTDFRTLGGSADLAPALAALVGAEGWRRIATHAGDLTDAACAALGLPVCRTDGPYDVAELETCDAGITQCDALIAQTGSVLVTSRSAGGRAISVLPPHHVVLARKDQLLGGMEEAFDLLKARYGTGWPSMMSFITGPSRTGDIERILVLGAHGPKKLTVFLV